MEFDYNYPGMTGITTIPNPLFTPLPTQASQPTQDIVLEGTGGSSNTINIQGSSES